MGLLDDAIREHLELKRRHGADPSEVARQEQEALGPPRRGEPAPADDAADEPVAAATLHDDEHELLDEEPYDGADEEQLSGAASIDRPTRPFDASELDDVGGDATEPEAGPEAEAPDPRAARDPGPSGESQGEDVLEETPEFLQETPEHDRLWFEQRPPRDFDF